MCPCFVNERVACIHRGGGEYWNSQCLSVLLWVQKSTEGEIVIRLFINLEGMFLRELSKSVGAGV